MRNQILHGYLIHHRKYRERSHIVYLFTREYGRINGILRQTPPPQYQAIRVQATGKGELKNFSQLELIEQPVFFAGDAFFAGFYLNEILLRLCALEVEMPDTFAQYAITLAKLQNLAQSSTSAIFLKQILRQFEHALLAELGYAVDFSVDAQQRSIEATQHYLFQLNEGFLPIAQPLESSISGQQLLTMLNYKNSGDFNPEQLQLLSQLYRQVIAALLGDRPLKSRQLWVQNFKS